MSDFRIYLKPSTISSPTATTKSNRLTRVHVRLPAHRPARFRHDYDQLHAGQTMRRAEEPKVLPPELP